MNFPQAGGVVYSRALIGHHDGKFWPDRFHDRLTGRKIVNQQQGKRERGTEMDDDEEGEAKLSGKIAFETNQAKRRG